MIDIETYRWVHLVSAFALFFAFGAAIGSEKKLKWVAPLHGIALVLILVAGFGMLARLGVMGGGLPGWVIGKLVIWLCMGGAIVLAKRKLLPAPVLLLVLLALGGVAAYLGIWKP